MLQQNLYRLGQMAAGFYVRTHLQTQMIWHTPLPDGPKIIAANHPTSSDPIWLMALFPERLHMVVTHSLGQIPIANWYLNHAGHLIQDKQHSTFERAVRCLRAGQNVGIFPEGGLTPLDHSTGQVRTGAVRMALITGVPIIPVGISILAEHITFRSYDFRDHQKQARWYLNGPYAITMGDPIYLEGNINEQERVAALSTALVAHIFDLGREGTDQLRISQVPEFAL